MATALHSMPSGVNEPALPLVTPLCELVIDRAEIARSGWGWARSLAAQLGGTPRDHLAEGQRRAWASARDTVASLDAARAMHARRALERAAEHAAAMLLALGLPRLVGPGFVSIDPVEAGAALDSAIAALDAMDAPAEDLEDDDPDEEDIPPEDDGTAEPSLASPEKNCNFCLNIPYYMGGSRYVDRSVYTSQISWAAGSNRDGEIEIVDEPHDEETDDDYNDRPERDESDFEPYLGAAENHDDQRRWAQDNRLDAEIEHRP